MPIGVAAARTIEIRSRAAGRLPPLTWLLRLLSWLVAAVTLLLAVASPPSEPVMIATRRIAIIRRADGREIAGGVSPVLRSARLIAMMRVDLLRLTEQQFLAEWGDHTRWKARFATRLRDRDRQRRMSSPDRRGID